jgi:hypothetical protein
MDLWQVTFVKNDIFEEEQRRTEANREEQGITEKNRFEE